MIAITEHPEGCVLPVRVQPGARRTGVVGEHGGALKVAVTALPQDGRANEAVIEVIRQAFGLKKPQVELLSGFTGRNKKLLFRGLSKRELGEIVAFILDR